MTQILKPVHKQGQIYCRSGYLISRTLDPVLPPVSFITHSDTQPGAATGTALHSELGETLQ